MFMPGPRAPSLAPRRSDPQALGPAFRRLPPAPAEVERARLVKSERGGRRDAAHAAPGALLEAVAAHVDVNAKTRWEHELRAGRHGGERERDREQTAAGNDRPRHHVTRSYLPGVTRSRARDAGCRVTRRGTTRRADGRGASTAPVDPGSGSRSERR